MFRSVVVVLQKVLRAGRFTYGGIHKINITSFVECFITRLEYSNFSTVYLCNNCASQDSSGELK